MTTAADTASHGCRRAMPQFKAERVPCFLQLDPGFHQPVPGVREILDPHFVEPVHAVVHELANVAEGDRFPLALDHHGLGRGVVPAAALLADGGGDVGQIHEFFVEQISPVEDQHGHVRPVAGFRHRGHTSLEAADADRFVDDLDAGGFFIGWCQSVFEEGVIGRNERAFVHHRHAFRRGERPRGASQAAHGRERGDFQHVAPRRGLDDVGHWLSLPSDRLLGGCL